MSCSIGIHYDSMQNAENKQVKEGPFSAPNQLVAAQEAPKAQNK